MAEKTQSKFQELQAIVKDRMEKVKAIFDGLDEKGGGMPDEAQRTELKKLYQEADEAEKRAAELKEWEDMRSHADSRLAEMQKAVRTVPVPGAEPANHGEAILQAINHLSGKSIGSQVFDDEEFKAWHEAMFKGGRTLGRSERVQSPTVSLKSLITGASSTSAGALVINDRKPLVDLPMRPLTLRDIITVGQTGSDTVEFARVTTQTNNAAPVPEATISSTIPDSDPTNTAGLKPESALALEVVTAAVKTIAHWIPATKRSLADAGQIRTLIDAFLLAGLQEELEDQILGGDNSGENFLGIHNTPNLSSQAWSTDILTTTRKARTVVRVTGRAVATAYVLNPTDWETIDLLQDNENRYYFGGPTVMGTPRLWGLPVVETEAETAGQGLCGDMRQAVLWDREQGAITMSDSHADFFIRNLVAILGELRAAFGVLRPAAICEMDLSAGS